MAQNIAIYKYSEVIFAVNTIPVEDMPEDSTISIEYDRDRVTKQIDVNTGGIYSWKHGKPARVTIQVFQHSPWVSALQNYRNLGKPVAITIEDRNTYDSRAKFACAKAMIQDGAVEFGTDATAVTFTFECIHLDDAYVPVDLIPTTSL